MCVRSTFVGVGVLDDPCLWKSNFAFETLPPPLRGPPPSTEGGEGCAATLIVGRLSCSRRLWESNFTYGKSQRLLRRSRPVVRVLHRLASADCYDALKSAGLPQQNFAALRMTHSRFAGRATIILDNLQFSRAARCPYEFGVFISLHFKFFTCHSFYRLEYVLAARKGGKSEKFLTGCTKSCTGCSHYACIF